MIEMVEMEEKGINYMFYVGESQSPSSKATNIIRTKRNRRHRS